MEEFTQSKAWPEMFVLPTVKFVLKVVMTYK